MTTKRQRGIQRFAKQIADCIEGGKQEYGETAVAIYRAIGSGAPGYAIEEKGLRYAKKGNPKDLVKAAAYAYLAMEALHDGVQD